jgi:hypothetical protein
MDTRLGWARASRDAMSKRNAYDPAGNKTPDTQHIAVAHSVVPPLNIINLDLFSQIT